MAATDHPLSERSLHLLKVLVESYIETGQPVGSRTLVKASGLDLSAATIRNVMSDLEDCGFIESPHTSAGRVPTVQGYRFFIDSLLKIRPISEILIAQLKERLTAEQQPQKMVEAASNFLAGITRLAGLVTTPRQEHASLRQIEFLRLSDHRILVILVTNQHQVQNRIIHLDRDVSAGELQQAANYLNEHYAGQDLRSMRQLMVHELEVVRQDMDRIMRSAIELAQKTLEGGEEPQEDLVIAGHVRLMDYQELSSVDKLRQLFDAFNQKRELLGILDKCIHAQGVQIFIGYESGYRVLDDCSVVTAPYMAEGDRMGVLGVIGPTRMAYDRIIPIVDVTAKLLGAALNSRLQSP